MSAPIANRYEFIYLFDVELGNPNGDPDAGNMPRIDYETNQGLVSDVCLKRKVRNFVDLTRQELGQSEGLNIYVREKAVLNRENEQAYKALGLKSEANKLPKDEEKAREVTAWMCKNFYDIRAFGAVMSTEVNCGQVRGPVQFSFAKSVEPVATQEVAITRMAVTNERDVEKERTIGRKYLIPYGLYKADGFVSAPLAERTGFTEDDLGLLWDALKLMFDHDRSAARGMMSARKLIAFKHAGKLGNAPANILFDSVQVKRVTEGPARSFADYEVVIDKSKIPQEIEVIELL